MSRPRSRDRPLPRRYAARPPPQGRGSAAFLAFSQSEGSAAPSGENRKCAAQRRQSELPKPVTGIGRLASAALRAHSSPCSSTKAAEQARPSGELVDVPVGPFLRSHVSRQSRPQSAGAARRTAIEIIAGGKRRRVFPGYERQAARPDAGQRIGAGRRGRIGGGGDENHRFLKSPGAILSRKEPRRPDECVIILRDEIASTPRIARWKLLRSNCCTKTASRRKLLRLCCAVSVSIPCT